MQAGARYPLGNCATVESVKLATGVVLVTVKGAVPVETVDTNFTADSCPEVLVVMPESQVIGAVAEGQ